ncbi:metal ABC transporter ATP-binding protein [Bradymonas sediminis]|uniref:Manganese ABC transporter ATP-binding protein n=1 Tax=Bradymonas sediminis TaxID=1548548 RepID=A0A2Z4FMV9_9DELT|nr:metal ABC transporter ATP-binding protein [Bradymonas sediminis]AWV90024.1 manganese ABC transporter ATP-binding protein [Bradymonas sediminis]TDP76018.1 manganese/zinc/iron transport system ATP- binding protein [Bradymonas sediminis]
MTYALQVENLTVSYGRGPVVKDVAFALDPGDLVGIVGPNGAGKSSMIKAMVGALTPDTGTIRVGADSGKKATRRITYVPQRGEVDWDFPVTVEDVVTQGRYGKVGLLGRFSKEDRRLVKEAIDLVGIGDLVKRQIGELSGGQQQRVFLARALAQQGDIYLLDEPLVGVDATTESAIVDVLRNLRDAGKSVMVVHHDLSTAREYFDKVLLMNKELIAFGPVEEVFTPELLQKTYGGRLTVLGGGSVAVRTG